MAIPLWAMMALAAVAKDEIMDKPKRQQQNQLRAVDQLVGSNNPTPFAQGDTAGKAMQAGFAGAALTQNMNSAESLNKLRDASLKNLNTKNQLLEQELGGQDFRTGSPLQGSPFAGENPFAGSQFSQMARQPSGQPGGPTPFQQDPRMFNQFQGQGQGSMFDQLARRQLN